MITVTNNFDNSKYNELFDKINNHPDLKGKIEIHSIEEFYQNIREIAMADVKFLRMPLGDDEPIIYVDANTRKINVDGTPFKTNGVAVQGDHIAETVFFKIDRFFDYMDFMNTKMYVDWKSPTNQGRSTCWIQSADIESGYVVFCWTIPKEATEKGGAITFALHCEKASETTGEIGYVFNTVPASLNIKDGLILVDPEVYDVKENIKAILFDSAFGEGEAAVPDVVWLTGLVKGKDVGNVLTLDLDNASAIVNLGSELSEDGPVIVPVDLYAVATSGLGTVMNYFDGDQNDIDEVYIAVPSSLEKLWENVTYYVKEGSVYTVASSDLIKAWDTDDKPTLYVSAAKITANQKGAYCAYGKGLKQIDDKTIGASTMSASDVIEVPGAEVPADIIVTADALEIPEVPAEASGEYTLLEDCDTIFLKDGTVTLSVSTGLSNGVGLLRFGLSQADVDEDGNDIVNTTYTDYSDSLSAEFTVAQETECEIVAEHFRNGDTVSSQVKKCIVSDIAAPIEASLPKDFQVLNLTRSRGGFTRNASGSFDISYKKVDGAEGALDADDISCDLIQASNGYSAAADFTHDKENNKFICTIDSADEGIANEYYYIKVSNNHNGLIYSTVTKDFVIRITD